MRYSDIQRVEKMRVTTRKEILYDILPGFLAQIESVHEP